MSGCVAAEWSVQTGTMHCDLTTRLGRGRERERERKRRAREYFIAGG